MLEFVSVVCVDMHLCENELVQCVGICVCYNVRVNLSVKMVKRRIIVINNTQLQVWQHKLN
mgnify:FL=1